MLATVTPSAGRWLHARDGDDDVVERQEGVLTRAQAAALVGRSAARRKVIRGLWASPWPGVLVCHNGPLTPTQRLWAALLACPTGSALGGWSALAFDGLSRGLAELPRVLIPDRARHPRLDSLLASHSAALGPADVHPDRVPRRTRPARSLIDAACWAPSAAAARVVPIEGVQAGVTTPDQLAEVLTTRGQCRYLGVLRETVLDLSGGIRSVPEHEFSLLVRRACLPAPARQTVVRGLDGRYYLDAEWPEWRVSAEVHGAHHGLIRQLDADWVRHNELTVGGRRVLHFTSFAVRWTPDAVASVLARALSLDLRSAS